MELRSVLTIVLLCVLISALDAERSTRYNKFKSKMLDGRKSLRTSSNSQYAPLLNILPNAKGRLLNKNKNNYGALSRKKRSTSLEKSQLNLIEAEVNFKDTDFYLPTNTEDDSQKQKNIKKRNACRDRNYRRRWNSLNYDKLNSINEKDGKNSDSSEESDENNTEGPLDGITNADNLSLNKMTVHQVTIKPSAQSLTTEDDNIKYINHDLKASNEDSGETADKAEFIFNNIPPKFNSNLKKKENKNLEESKTKNNVRIERGVIEEESVVPTVPRFKIISRDSDSGSRVAFRNINV